MAKLVVLGSEFVMRVCDAYVCLNSGFMCAGVQFVMISRDYRLLIYVHVTLEIEN